MEPQGSPKRERDDEPSTPPDHKRARDSGLEPAISDEEFASSEIVISDEDWDDLHEAFFSRPDHQYRKPAVEISLDVVLAELLSDVPLRDVIAEVFTQEKKS